MWSVNSTAISKVAGESVLALRAGDGIAAGLQPGEEEVDHEVNGQSTVPRVLRQSSPRRARFAAVGVAAIAVVGLLTVLVDDTLEDGPSRYSAASYSLPILAQHCDDPLGKSRLFSRSRTVAYGMCAEHDGHASMSLQDLADGDLRFLVLGDWGRDGMCCQRDVASEMAVAAKAISPAFVVSVGDSFYPRGVRSVHDVQFNTSWRDVYITRHESMGTVPWKIVAGNHDYLGRITAQLELAGRDPMWRYPALYYFESVQQGQIFLAFLDTTPMYYHAHELDEFMDSGVAINSTVLDAQVQALQNELAASNAKIKLVFGHHPLVSSSDHAIQNSDNARRMQDLLLKTFVDNKVTAYFCGHEHTLEHSVIDGVHFFISGAGSKLSKIEVLAEGNIFALSSHGYIAASASKNMLRVRFVDYTGTVVHSVNIAV